MLAALMNRVVPRQAPLSPDPERIEREAAELRPVVVATVACILREPRDHEDVDDCANEAIRRAMESTHTLRGAVRPWLLGIARHLALDTLRARQRARNRIADSRDDSSATSLMDRIIDPQGSPYEVLAQAEQVKLVRRVLEGLPEGPRKALELFHLEELGYQEIAERMQVPLGTVATWVTRSRKAIATALAEGAMS